MYDAEVATIGDLHREMERVAELLEVLNHKVALQEARVDAIIAAIARTPGAAVPFKAAQPKPPPLVPFRYMSAAEQAAHPFYKTAPLRRPPSAADDIAEPALHKAPPMQQPPSSTAEEVLGNGSGRLRRLLGSGRLRGPPMTSPSPCCTRRLRRSSRFVFDVIAAELLEFVFVVFQPPDCRLDCRCRKFCELDVPKRNSLLHRLIDYRS